jgi:hypothetical protein
MRLRSLCLGLVLLAAALLPAEAQDAATPVGPSAIVLSGDGHPSVTLTPAVLAARPQTELAVSFQTSKGPFSGTYRGVLLWTLLSDAGLVGTGDPHAVLRQSVVVTGRDGYAVVFGAGEIAPDLGGRQVLLATAVDGQPLPADENMRLVVPGDKRGARSVRDVVSITVKSLEP